MFTQHQLDTALDVLQKSASWLRIHEPYAVATIRLFEDAILSLPAAPYEPKNPEA